MKFYWSDQYEIVRTFRSTGYIRIFWSLNLVWPTPHQSLTSFWWNFKGVISILPCYSYCKEIWSNVLLNTAFIWVTCVVQKTYSLSCRQTGLAEAQSIFIRGLLVLFILIVECLYIFFSGKKTCMPFLFENINWQNNTAIPSFVFHR